MAVGPARIACVNLPHVAVATEERDNPQLVGRAVAIETPHPGPRAVYDLSHTAHRAGIRPGMTLVQARKVCPEVIVVPPRPEIYHETFEAMVRTLTEFTSLVEPLDLERSWLSTAGLIARGGRERSFLEELAGQVRREVDLAVRVGLAHGKQTSKIVTHYLEGKEVMVLPPGREVTFLGGLTVGYLPLAARNLEQLAQLGLRKVRQYAALPSRGILPRFGHEGLRAYMLSHGEDDARVRAYQVEPFLEAEHVLLDPVADLEVLRHLLAHLVAQVTTPLSASFQMARSLRVTVTLENGQVVYRERTMDTPAINKRRLLTQAEALTRDIEWSAAIERVKVGVQGLCPTQVRQLDLFRRDHAQRIGVQSTLRNLQAKFGDEVVRQGRRLEPDSPLHERRAYLIAWGDTA
jgi:DNA polymerase-4